MWQISLAHHNLNFQSIFVYTRGTLKVYRESRVKSCTRYFSSRDTVNLQVTFFFNLYTILYSCDNICQTILILQNIDPPENFMRM